MGLKNTIPYKKTIAVCCLVLDASYLFLIKSKLFYESYLIENNNNKKKYRNFKLDIIIIVIIIIIFVIIDLEKKNNFFFFGSTDIL